MGEGSKIAGLCFFVEPGARLIQKTLPPRDRSPARPCAPLRIAAATCNLALGGSTTFLLNFQRALAPETGRLRVSLAKTAKRDGVGFRRRGRGGAGRRAGGADLRGPARVGLTVRSRQGSRRRCSRAWARKASRCSGWRRGASRGSAVIQSDDPLPYAMARRYHAALDAMVGVSPEICAKLRALPELARTAGGGDPVRHPLCPKLERPPRAPGEPLRILYLGRVMEEQKRIGRVLEVVRALEGGAEDFRVTIAGVGRGRGDGAGGAGGLADRAGDRRGAECARAGAAAARTTSTCCSRISKGCRSACSRRWARAGAGGFGSAERHPRSGHRREGVRVPVGDVAGGGGGAPGAPARAGAAGERSRAGAGAGAAGVFGPAMVGAIRRADPLDRPSGRGCPWPAETRIPAPLGLAGVALLRASPGRRCGAR